MTVISDLKKPKNQNSGQLMNNEIETLDNNSNDINENASTTQVLDDNEILSIKVEEDLHFSVDVMRRFIDMVNKPRWVVPVLPKDDLENMLFIAIKYSYQKKDVEVEHFKELYKNGFLVSFEKIMTDDAVLGWKIDILESIYRNSIIMMQLCSIKILDDNLYILDILSIIFNPDIKYHQCCLNNCIQPNKVRMTLLDDLVQTNQKLGEHLEIDNDAVENSSDQKYQDLPDITEYKYASSSDNRRNKIIYIDLINIFGYFKGFDNLKRRFDKFNELSSPDLSFNLSLLLALLKPIALSIDYLTPFTIEEFIKPIVNKSVKLILSVDEDVLKQEAIKEWKSDKFSNIIQHIEIILRKINSENDLLNQLTLFRLNIILKILQHASFNGRMNALNELNKLIKSISSTMYPSHSSDEHILKWIKNNEVLNIVLKENLHQPQYVEKVEKLIQFMVKSNGLTNEDLDKLWDSQIGKHEAIITNIHDLLAKLAYDFNQTQLHHLFDCFQNSWSKASKKQRERLIDLIRKLAEEDKEGRMAKTALKLLWDLAIKNDSTLDILESALRAHVKILDFSCIQALFIFNKVHIEEDRDYHRNEWLNNLINYLNDQNIRKNALSALRQIREIIKLYQQAIFNSTKSISRSMIIQQLEKDHQILNLITNNLIEYVDSFRKSEIDLNDNNFSYLDEKFPHEIQIDDRLELLKFLLVDGSLILNNSLLSSIWTCLVVSPHDCNNSSILTDRDQCFKWLASLMEIDKIPFEEQMMENFFLDNFLKLDPKLLTLSGILLFEQFFRSINQKKGFIREIDSDNYVVIHTELVGLDYLWRCAMHCVDDEVFNKIIHILKMITTNLSFNLIEKRNSINEEFIQHCIHIMSSAFDTAKCLLSKCHVVSTSEDNFQENYYEVSLEMEESVNKMTNIIQILCEFVRECDNRFIIERKNPALCRITYGHLRKVTVMFTSCFGRNNSVHHIEIDVHSNELFINLRKKIEVQWQDFQKDDCTLELSKGNDMIIEEKDNYKTLEQLEITNGSVINARMVPMFSNSLPYSKLEKHEEIDAEKNEDNLPGVIISRNKTNMELIINIGDLSLKINIEKLRWAIQHLLNLLPPDFHLQMSITDSILKVPGHSDHLEEMLLRGTPMQTIYAVNILYCLLLPCNNQKASNESIALLKNLLKNNTFKNLLEIIHFDNKHFMSIFVPKNCETSSIPLIGLIRLLKIIYLLLSIYGGISAIKEKINSKIKIKKLQELLKESSYHWTIPYQIISEKLQNVIKEYENDKEMLTTISSKLLVQRKDVDSFIKLSWSCAVGNKLELMSCDIKKFHEKYPPLNLTERSRSVTSFRPDTSLSSINNNNGFWRTETDIYELINQPTFCAIECLSLAMACSADTNIFDLIKEKYTKEFIMVLLLYIRNSHIRRKSAEEFRLILRFSDSSKALEHVIQMLFTKLHNVGENPIQYGDVFNLVVKLLNDTHKMGSQLSNTEALLKCQLARLLELKSLPDNVSNQVRMAYEVVLIGRLKIIKELLRFFTPQSKSQINKTHDLINILLNQFLFPSSKRYSDIKLYQQEAHRDFQMPYCEENREFPSWATSPLMNPICNSLESQRAAFELLRVLVAGSCQNMEQLCEKLNTFFYCDHRFSLNEWDYKPSFVSRSATGFVGLKNAGATCYMNSIIQQLFMISPIRNALLAVDAGPPDIRDEFEDNILYNVRKETTKKPTDSKSIKIDILREIQMIFGNLAFSQNQYFTPSGFWKHFKLWGDEVNLREQHDALEFFNCLVDTVDEGLHAIGMTKIFEEVLGGTFADQKICKGCPHRYECEEKFSTLSVDIRHHENLIESLEQYVKGDLLEGDNAYYCESCKEKRDTVKRMCIKKLPLILAIQLKRFDYDWERDTSVKFNDYFEFPTELDMAPYTVAGTSKRDHLNSINEIVRSPSLSSSESDCLDTSECSQNPESSTRYTLKGVVVHGGQASGGHYYSYIKEKRKYEGGTPCNCSDSCSSVNNGIDSDDFNYCWYRFDDTEVSECKMDAEEMKNQWFGGDFMGESYDHIVKRVSLRRQKRWWSAYILFYEREDYVNHQSLSDLQQAVLLKTKSSIPSAVDGNNIFNIARLPRHIEENITLQNIEYMHTKSQYTTEYFSFLRDLPSLVCPDQDHLPVKMDKTDFSVVELEKMRAQVASLLSKFLFATGFKTNRAIRGPALDWFYSLKLILQNSERARLEFCTHAFFFPLTKITEYLVDSPNSEIRMVYATFIRFISHWSIKDASSGYNYTEFQRDPHLKDLFIFIKERFPVDEKLKLCHILMAVMHLLLNKDTNEYGSNANELMSIFYEYPNMGFEELNHCLDFNLATHLLKYCLDEYYPNAGSNRVDINKLICSFCQMMRCYNLQSTCSDIQIDMLIPHKQALQQIYPKEPPDIPASEINNPYHFRMNNKPVWKIRNIPNHLYKYIFQRTNNFIKRVVEDFCNEFTKDDLIKFLKYLSFDNPQCSQIIIETLCNELIHSCIRYVKSFLELFRGVLKVSDSWKVRRALIMIEGEQLDFALRIKGSSERRCYFTLKMILFALNQLTEDEKKQLWEDLSNAKHTHEKLNKAMTNLTNLLHNFSNEQKIRGDYRPHIVIESNEDSNANNIERTDSIEEMEKIGKEMLRLYINVTPEESVEVSQSNSSDPDSTSYKKEELSYSCESYTGESQLDSNIQPPPYNPLDEQMTNDDINSSSGTSSLSPCASMPSLK